MLTGYNKKLVVDCICGGSFCCTEDELRASQSGVRECGALIGTKGNYTNCKVKYSYLRLLKIMQLTNNWDAKDEQTYERAENVKVEV